MLIASNDVIGTFRAKEIHITKSVGYGEVDLGVTKAVSSIHWVPDEEWKLERHDFDHFKDVQAFEHMNLIVNDCLGLRLIHRIWNILATYLTAHVVLNDRCRHFWLQFQQNCHWVIFLLLSEQRGLDELGAQELLWLIKVGVTIWMVILWVPRLNSGCRDTEKCLNSPDIMTGIE